MSSFDPQITGTTSASGDFLSLLSARDNGGDPLSKLFQNLLEATQDLNNSSGGQISSSLKTRVSSSSADSSALGSSSIAPPAYDSLKDIVAALRDFANKWNDYQSRHNDGSSTTKDNTPSVPESHNSSSVQSSSTPSSASAAPTTSTGTTTTAVSSQTTSSGSTAGDTTTPTLADLIAQLQTIAQMLQQKLQTAGTTDSATTAATDPAGSQPTADLLVAAGALGDLLALAQKFEKKSDSSSPADTAQNASAAADLTITANASPDLATLDQQLRSDLKGLLDALKTAADTQNNTPATNAANIVPATAPASAPSPNSQASVDSNNGAIGQNPTFDPTLATTAPTTSAAKTTPATPNDIIKGAIAAADDFIKQLDRLRAPEALPTNIAAATITGTLPADSETSNNLDSNLNNGKNFAATNGDPQNADPGLTPTESGKTSNPYGFASQLSASRAQNSSIAGLPTAVEQALLFINKNAKNGNDQMTLQLHPADLGTISVKLAFAGDGSVSGSVTASNADTLAMLQKDSRSLERALQEAGLRADPGSLQFNLGGQSTSSNSGQTGDNPASGLNGSAATEPNLDVSASQTAADTATSWVITPGRVNIIV